MLEWPELEVWADSLEDAGVETLGLRLGLFVGGAYYQRHPGIDGETGNAHSDGYGVGNGYGYGYGYNIGYGSGYGFGYGSGDGYGYSYGLYK